MATTLRADREVVVLLGVPGPCSFGVVGSEGGGGTGREISVWWLTEGHSSLTVYEHSWFPVHFCTSMRCSRVSGGDRLVAVDRIWM